MAEPKKSVSQEPQGTVDQGEESFSVDTTPVEIKPGIDAPAKEEVVDDEVSDDEVTPPSDDDEGGEVPPVEDVTPVEDDDKLPKGVQKRLDKMRRKQGDAERETEALRDEIKALKKAAEARPDIGARPDITNFETEGEYLEALTDYKVKQAMAEQTEKQIVKDEESAKQRQEDLAKQRYKEIQRALRESSASKHDDFDDVIENLKMTDTMIQIIERLPNLGDVAYELGKKPSLVEDIADMPAIEAALKLKEISDNLKTKKVTKAPAPVRPVSGSGGGIKSLEDMTQAEYNKVRDKQDKERKGRY